MATPPSGDTDDPAIQQLAKLLSHCTYSDILEYAQSHLWVNTHNGELADCNLHRRPDTDATKNLKTAFIKQGFRYVLLSDDEKRTEGSFLDQMKDQSMNIDQIKAGSESDNAIVRCLSNIMNGHESQTEGKLCEYLDLLVEYMTWNMLLNTFRYNRCSEERRQQGYHEAIRHAKLLVFHCSLGHSGNYYPGNELRVRMGNLMIILALFVEEGRYKGLKEKLRRGRRGDELREIVEFATLKGEGTLNLEEKWITKWGCQCRVVENVINALAEKGDPPSEGQKPDWEIGLESDGNALDGI